MTDEFGPTPEVQNDTPVMPEAVNIGVSNEQGRVIVNFANPVAWFALQPDQAIELGMLIMNNAAAAKKQLEWARTVQLGQGGNGSTPGG